MSLVTRALLSLSALSCAVHANAQTAGMPAPRYLQVPSFKQCLASQQIKTYSAWCLPADKPQACPQDSWDALSRLSGVDKMPACEPAAMPEPNTPAFTGSDYSGTYDCKGQDSHEGPYDGTITLELVRAQSRGAYNFRITAPASPPSSEAPKASGLSASSTTSPSSRAATTALKRAFSAEVLHCQA